MKKILKEGRQLMRGRGKREGREDMMKEAETGDMTKETETGYMTKDTEPGDMTKETLTGDMMKETGVLPTIIEVEGGSVARALLPKTETTGVVQVRGHAHYRSCSFHRDSRYGKILLVHISYILTISDFN